MRLIRYTPLSRVSLSSGYGDVVIVKSHTIDSIYLASEADALIAEARWLAQNGCPENNGSSMHAVSEWYKRRDAFLAATERGEGMKRSASEIAHLYQTNAIPPDRPYVDAADLAAKERECEFFKSYSLALHRLFVKVAAEVTTDGSPGQMERVIEDKFAASESARRKAEAERYAAEVDQRTLGLSRLQLRKQSATIERLTKALQFTRERIMVTSDERLKAVIDSALSLTPATKPPASMVEQALGIDGAPEYPETPATDGWVPVTTPPTTADRYNTWDGDMVRTAYWNNGWEEDESTSELRVTHWRPLPPAPVKP